MSRQRLRAWGGNPGCERERGRIYRPVMGREQENACGCTGLETRKSPRAGP